MLAICTGFGSENWRFEVYSSTGDDTFNLDTTFTKTTSNYGSLHGGSGDTDNDGMEEALLSFHPEDIYL